MVYFFLICVFTLFALYTERQVNIQSYAGYCRAQAIKFYLLNRKWVKNGPAGWVSIFPEFN